MGADVPEEIGGNSWRFLVSAVGILLFVVGVGSVLLDGRLTGEELLQVSSLALLSLLLVVVGTRIAVDIDDAGDAMRVLGWMSAGVLALAALGVWLELVVPTVQSRFESALVFLSVLSAGALFGSVVGYYDVRVRGLVERASREQARREFLDDQQDALSALNRTLDHQIRNDLSVIRGQAELLRAGRVDPEAATETIETYSDHTADIVSRLGTAVDVLTGAGTTDETSLDGAITHAIDSLHETHPDAAVAVDGDTDVVVRADDLVALALAEVLENAVVHGGPPVTVTVESADERVVVAITDAGSGIDVTPPEALFDANTRGEASDGDGLGLFLADLILDQYDGEIQMREDDRTTFELHLDAGGAAI